MKVTVFKRKGTKETVVREELDTIVDAISGGKYVNEVHRLRQYYHLMSPHWTEDGKMKTNFDFKLTLPRLCFAAEIDKYRKEHRVLNYNGLIVLEANNLADYDEAIKIRNMAARLPQTMMAFLGASGRSVKIVCRGELLPDNGGGLAIDPADIERFHLALYKTARKAYNAQLDITFDAVKPLIHRTIYMTADPEMTYRAQAVPFYIDMNEGRAMPETTLEDVAPEAAHYLMPGRTLKQTYNLNFQFILTEVMGHYFDLPSSQVPGAGHP